MEEVDMITGEPVDPDEPKGFVGQIGYAPDIGGIRIDETATQKVVKQPSPVILSPAQQHVGIKRQGIDRGREVYVKRIKDRFSKPALTVTQTGKVVSFISGGTESIMQAAHGNTVGALVGLTIAASSLGFSQLEITIKNRMRRTRKP